MAMATIKLEADELAGWKSHAEARGLTMSEWVRDLCRKAMAGELVPRETVSAEHTPLAKPELSYEGEASDGGTDS